MFIGFGEIDNGQYDRIAERYFISGALMLIKRNVFKKIGLLPEVYFFGKEDREFSTRARKAGFQILYHPKFSVYHEASHSHETTNILYIYNGTLSRIIYHRRNSAHALFTLWILMYKIYLLFLFPLRYRLKKKKYLQGVSWDKLRKTMIDALRDAPRIKKITEKILIDYKNRGMYGHK